MISRSLQAKLLLEIGVTHLSCLFRRPGLHAHFLDQTEVEYLNVMGPLSRHVSVWMQIVAGKIRAVTAEAKPFLCDASVNLAGLRHVDGAYSTAFMPAPSAHRFFERDAHSIRDELSQILVGNCSV